MDNKIKNNISKTSSVDLVGNNVLDSSHKIGNLGENLIKEVQEGKENIINDIKNDEITPGNATFKDKFVKGFKKYSVKLGKVALKNPGKTLIAGIAITAMGAQVMTIGEPDLGEKLSMLQANNVIESPLDSFENEQILNTLAANENIFDDVEEVSNAKYNYSFFKNNNGRYTFLGYGANVNKIEDIELLAKDKGIDFKLVDIERADSDEDIYHKNLILSSKNPNKMKELLSLLTKGGDDVDRDDNFITIYKYNINDTISNKYVNEIKEINEFGNIVLKK